MTSRRVGAVLFWAGVVVLLTHTTVLFVWWALLSTPYPLYASSGPLFFLSGLTPMIGPFMMLTGGLVYGRQGAVDR